MSTAHVSLRLDVQLRRQVEAFRVSSGFETPSQAMRALLLLGLGRGEQLPDDFRRAALQEATRAVQARLQVTLAQLMEEFR
jgi:hypothetical protein